MSAQYKSCLRPITSLWNLCLSIKGDIDWPIITSISYNTQVYQSESCGAPPPPPPPGEPHDHDDDYDRGLSTHTGVFDCNSLTSFWNLQLRNMDLLGGDSDSESSSRVPTFFQLYKFQVLSRFVVLNSRFFQGSFGPHYWYFHTNFSYNNLKMC